MLTSDASAIECALCAALWTLIRITTLQDRYRCRALDIDLVGGGLKNADKDGLRVDEAVRVPHGADFESHSRKAKMA